MKKDKIPWLDIIMTAIFCISLIALLVFVVEGFFYSWNHPELTRMQLMQRPESGKMFVAIVGLFGSIYYIKNKY